jgi:hypothetical protein
LTVRTSEFTVRPIGVTTVYIIENEISYLAFPTLARGMAIFGGGYSVGLLKSIPWLADVDLVYWDDIDTHGFAILNRLRGHFPHVTSMLMDSDTLVSHSSHWNRELSQVTHPLTRLSTEETELWQELCAHTHGPSVRLEQERIRFSTVRDRIARMGSATRTGPRPP